MNLTNASLRSLVVLGAGAVLALTACGGDDDATDAVTSTTAVAPTTPTPADPPLQPATITFTAQDSDGIDITIDAVELPSAGFVAVHIDADGSPGAVIGVSDLLPAGTSTDVPVALDEPLAADTTVHPMAHIDTDSNGIYEFGTVTGVDGPALTSDGQVAVASAVVDVASADPTDIGTDDEPDAGAGDADGDTITIADFSFSGVTEVAVGTTVVVTNEDATPHTWTAEDGTFDSGAIAPGESFEFTFTDAGEFTYFCNFHPSMTGRIVVTS